MKSFLIKLSLIATLVVACNTAMAEFTDEALLKALLHCDETNQMDYWLITPDDNSSGRTANEPILDKAIGGDDIVDVTTEPTLMPDSPEGGSYFSFDGTNDSIYLIPGWSGGDSVVCDFSFRFFTPPVTPGYPFAGLVTCQSFTCFLSTGTDHGGINLPHISVMVESNDMIHSPVVLETNTWYNVVITIVNDEVRIIVNGSAYTKQSGWSLPSYVGPMRIGCFPRADFLQNDAGFLDGDMDEIRIGNVPEPFTFGLIGLLGLIVFRRK